MVSLLSRSTNRDRLVTKYVRRELYPHTSAGRARIDESTLSGGRMRNAAELRRIPPVDIEDVGDGSEYLVRPTRHTLLRSAKPTMRLRTLWATSWGRWKAFLNAIEPRYRPVHFFGADGVPVGAAAADLVRLAGLGASWMVALGIRRDENVALVGGASSGVEAWELSGGTRRAGISLAVFADATKARRNDVAVLAGTTDAVVEALREGGWPSLRMVLVLGDPSRAVTVPEGVELRRAWAPRGTRAVWFECRGGADYGWHTTPTAEFVEVDDHDEIVWTGIGWAGTVFLRLRTDVRAERVEDATCPACGHAGPRLFFGDGRPALARWLQADDRVAAVRLHAEGADVLPVRAGANARLLKQAAAKFPGHTVTVKSKKTWDES